MSERNQIMKYYDLEPGDLVRIKKRDLVIEGIVMPPYIFTDPWVLVIKLKNGYNIGIHIEEIKELKIINKGAVREQTEEIRKINQETDLPRIKVIGTGG
ncbi:MAG: Glu-tRNA(Gln) amidotransferase subunit GatD, partial [Sulfolobales archaeon]